MIEKISIITLTYGNRLPLLTSSIENWKQNINPLAQIIIVNNASSDDLNPLKKIPFVKILDFNENLGSALGFAKGLEYLHQNGYRGHILLLDDDNQVTHQFSEKVSTCWTELNCSNSDDAIACFRPQAILQQRVLHREDPSEVFLVKNTFLGFSIFNIIKNQLRKHKFSQLTPSTRPYAQIPMAPYGGLVFHADLLKRIGVPDASYYLYADDFEYTYRIARQGRIFLLRDAQVNDVQLSWDNEQIKSEKYLPIFLAQGDWRMYYHVRNWDRFMHKINTNNQLIFKLNKWLYVIMLKLFSIFYNKQSAYELFLSALEDSRNGNFGKKIFENE